MGWAFPLKHTNLVAFITAPEGARSPELTRGDLLEFFASFGSFPRHDQEKQPWHARLISSRPDFVDQVQRAAMAALERVQAMSGDWDFKLTPESIGALVEDLRRLLGDYDLFAIGVRSSPDAQLEAFLEEAAYSSGGSALYLLPDEFTPTFSMLAPFPSVAMIAEQPDKWPGVLFWSRSGAAAFCSLDQARLIHAQLVQFFQQPPPDLEQKIDRLLDSARTPGRSKKVLHLSDLHFGTDFALRNEAYLSAQLAKVIPEMSRVVITGDLMQNPTKRNFLEFRNFLASLMRLGKDPILIPGNHDRKWMGMFGESLRSLVEVEWSKVVVDDDMQCAFLCFDSTRDADYAKGKVTADQLMEVGTLYETKCVQTPVVQEYLRIALIHHHPFSFDARAETWTQRWLKRFRLDEERFLRMEEPERFLEWCAKRGVPLILHGHKHVPRHVEQTVGIGNRGNVRPVRITAVGCGTSLGAEDVALSYNVVTWDDSSRRWTVSCFADSGDGSGFLRERVDLQQSA